MGQWAETEQEVGSEDSARRRKEEGRKEEGGREEGGGRRGEGGRRKGGGRKEEGGSEEWVLWRKQGKGRGQKMLPTGVSVTSHENKVQSKQTESETTEEAATEPEEKHTEGLGHSWAIGSRHTPGQP